MAGWASRGLVAAPLSDGRIQLWVTDSPGAIWSTWQIPFDWVYWQNPWTPALPSFSTQQVAAAPLSDGRLQFWAVDNTGKIWSCWKSNTSSNAPWTPWTSNWTPSPPPFQAVQVAAAPLSDKRLQFWAVDTTGKIWSCWKSNTASNAPWTAWTSSWTPGPPSFQAVQVAAAPLSDKRLQFWAVDTAGKIWSCWKSTTSSNAPWTAWTTSWIADVPTFQTRTLYSAPLADGRLAVWVIDTQGQVRTAVKTTTDSSAAWSNWALMFNMRRQEQTNWCWAGCGVGTSHFYTPSSPWTQCELANAELGSTTCCPNPGPCNVYGYLNTSLQTVGNFDFMTGGTQPQATVTAQADLGRPLGVRVAWSGGGAHFLMVVGGGVNNMVTVEDPWYGASYIPYATLVSGYQGTGSWTHSYFTKP